MFDVNTLTGDEALAEQEVATKDVNLTVDEVTLAQALAALKSVKNQANVVEEPSVPVSAASTKVSAATTTATATIPTPRKGIIITKLEPDKPLKKKDQISSDEQEAIRLQAEFYKDKRLAREKDEANLAQRLQAEEQEQFTTEQKVTLFKKLLEQRRKHFASKRAEEKRNKPPTKSQQKKTMITYLKNMEGWKHKDLKSKDFDSIKELFDKAFKRVNMFVDYRTNLVEAYEIVPDEEEVSIDVISLATKPPTIVDWKIHKEGKKNYYQIIRADGSSKMYLVFSHMLKSFDMEDFETLWKLGRIVGIKSFLMLFGITTVLIDVNAGTDRSFMSTTFSTLLDITPDTLDVSYAVELADERIFKTNIVLRGCTLGLFGHPFNIDLMPVQLGSFDVIIGMDWLANHHAVIACDENIVWIPYGDEVLIVQGDRSEKGKKSKLSIISCTKTQKYIKRGCLIFLAQITKKETENKSKENQLEDVPIVQEFPEVFPKDFPGLPPATSQIPNRLSPSEEEHAKHLKLILELLKKEELYAKFPKCKFWLSEVQFLSHMIDSEGIHVDPTKIESVKDWASPKTPTNIRQFLGLAGYYQRFIKEAAFQLLKQKLYSALILALPEGSENFVVYCDASRKGLGAGNPQMDLQDQGVIDSGCSRHMTGNMSYLTDYEEIDGGYVAFGGNPKGGKITRKCTIKTGIFDGKADEGFFVGYSLNSKAFEVFNSRTRIVEENLHIRFNENTPNAVGQARKETEPVKNYILLLLWTADPPFSQDPKSSHEDGSKPSNNVNSTNNVNAASTNEVNVVGGKTSIELPFDPNMLVLGDYNIFNLSRDDEDVGTEADMNNLDITIQVSPNPTTRLHKDHPLDQMIKDLQSTTQTRKMSKNLEEHGFVSTIQQRTNHKDLQNCLFAFFLSQEEPKKVIHALKDPSWIEAMQEELVQFKLQEVWTLVDLPNEKRAIGTKWVFRNKKDERGIVIRNKERLVAQGYTQEEGIDYDKVFALVTRIEEISLFLAYVSFKDFIVYQMDIKSAFLYGKIEEEVYVCQPPGFENPNFPHRVYKVDKALYGLHQAPRAWYETLSTYLLDNRFQRGEIDKTLFIKRHKGDILLVQVYVDDIIFVSTKKELCNAFEKLMHEKFQMSSIGELTFFLGLQKFRFTEVKTTSTPMETQKPLLKDENGEEVDVHLYRSMIGSLMYLTSLRPDIMFVVCAYARYQVNPKVSHLYAVKRIFRYLKGQLTLGFWYPKDSPFDLVAYTDSDYAGASLDMKSTTGGC
ncbi:putative ribonuclease H-like domain-containing protein [Tanacetum coccineum]